MVRTRGQLRVDAAAAVYESRFASGPLARRHVPGNLRTSPDQPSDNLLVRRGLALLSGAFEQAAASRNDGNVARQLAAHGRVLFAPDAPIDTPRPTLVKPLLRVLHDHGRARGRDVRAGRGAPLTAAAPTAAVLAGLAAPLWPLLPRPARRVLLAGGAAYAAGLSAASVHAGIGHRSVRVASAFAAAVPASHLAYGSGVLRGLLQRGAES
jgi:hypothetical protein